MNPARPTLNNHENFIQRSINLAASAVKNGNHPFAALLVHEGILLLEMENTVLTEQDPTQHAELRLVSQAARRFEHSFLKECTIYCSTEPCTMCTGAIYWTGIRKIAFGCTAKQLAKHVGEDFLTPCSQILSSCVEEVEILGPLLGTLAEKIHAQYWNTKD